MKGRLTRPVLAALVIVGGLAVAGGIAYANIPDSSGVIHGCYQKNQGSLRIIDTGQSQTCSSSESPLNWSQTGPQGQKGDPGQQGIQGPPGPSGSSHAYSTFNLDALTHLAPGANTITQLTLPAGHYVVWATGDVVKQGTFNTVGSQNDVKCSLNDPDDNAVTASQAEAKFDDGDAVPYVLVDTMSLASEGTITVECTTLDGSVVSEVDNNTLVATAVDAIN